MNKTHDILDRLLIQPVQETVQIPHLLISVLRLFVRDPLSLPSGRIRMPLLVVRRDQAKAFDASRAIVGTGWRRGKTSRVGTAGMYR